MPLISWVSYWSSTHILARIIMFSIIEFITFPSSTNEAVVSNYPVPSDLPKPAQRKVMCYPAQVCALSPYCSGVEHHIDGEVTYLRYKGETHKLNTTHFHKLVSDLFLMLFIYVKYCSLACFWSEFVDSWSTELDRGMFEGHTTCHHYSLN